ncbi:hypothetical protein DFP73DRAFT_540414, partial [Morchella snyderi]
MMHVLLAIPLLYLPSIAIAKCKYIQTYILWLHSRRNTRSTMKKSITHIHHPFQYPNNRKKAKKKNRNQMISMYQFMVLQEV